LIQRAGSQILRVLDVLQDYAVIEAKASGAYYGPVELSPFTGKIAETFRSVIERTGIRYVVDCPASAEIAYVDTEMWEKIVLNLVSNSFRHMHQGEVTVTVRTLGNQFVLEVADTGEGIPENQIERLFDPFYSLPREHGRVRPGLGMGLALSKAFVELH